MGTFEEENPELAAMLDQAGLVVEETKEEEVNMGANFDELKNFKPEEINDENEFKPLKGAYTCRIEKFEHKQGISERTGKEYDFYGLRLQVTETMEGDKGDNRFLDKIYRNDNEGIKKLLNDMFTAGIEIDRSSEQALDASLGTTKDKLVKIRAWVWTPEKDMAGNLIPEDQRVSRQQLKIIKEFKLGQEKPRESLKSSEVPF